MSDDELTALQEELAAARSELEQLQATVADREARAAHLESQLSALREELAEAQQQAQSREEEAAGLREQASALETRVRSAAQRYRELVLERSPELPEELVAGASVEEIDEALERARETVSKVRGHLESQAQAARVPVGAPVRSAPDFSTMTAEQKISQGLRQRSG